MTDRIAPWSAFSGLETDSLLHKDSSTWKEHPNYEAYEQNKYPWLAPTNILSVMVPTTTFLNLDQAFAQAWEAATADSDDLLDESATTRSERHEHLHPVFRPPRGPLPQRPRPIYVPNNIVIRRDSNGAPQLSFINSAPNCPRTGSFVAEVPKQQQTHCAAYADCWNDNPYSLPDLTPPAATFIDEKRLRIEQESLEPIFNLDDCTATAQDLSTLTTAHPLPRVQESSRWTNWRHMTYYMRMWALILLANIITIIVLLLSTVNNTSSFGYRDAATAVGANLLLATLARHEHFINMLFRMACILPISTPLWIRRRAAKVYSYGGIHSGCGISAMLWYIVYATLATFQFQGTRAEQTALAITTTLTIVLLVMIIGMAHPAVRRCFHNQWEVTHRFGGWTVVLLVWAQTVIIIVVNAHRASQPTVTVLSKTPTFYFLLIITVLIIYPWLRLRRRTITHSERLSNHALRLHFNDRRVSHCIGYRLATNPLLENHGFATIPNPTNSSGSDADPKKGYSILISNAGDWTSRQINDPPKHIWTKGAPTVGLMRVASLFSPLVILATGSGIGPALSFLQAKPEWQVRVIWSARSPLKTYGSDILNAVLKADPRAIVVDTALTGHPDLVALAWAVKEESRAEAVMVVANPKVTNTVVGGLEKRGVPAYGALFDS
ncbi:uncharacterized protein LTR77_011084 [Saxophila tyrrhenica]|uniref:Integral membrane protein TmpA n=1 Tax=Saxophila tyrrhenica TaxID=1690608 RepID=A0AAV9NTJ6_9PEZI|nr:hypothetical protein LTR77_011084 [Saxophila tyrrhenica]